jgi:hypothetical protein
VPDFLFGSFGNVIFKTCASIAGAEGRCVPRCVTPVQDIIQYLPADVCTPAEVCAPCFDPRTGASTGVCTNGCAPGEECPAGCDPGPTQPPVVFQKCCPVAAPADAGRDSGVDGGKLNTGMCVPPAVVDSVTPGAAALFSSAGCDTPGYLCVPQNLDLARLGSFACLQRSVSDSGIPDSGARSDASAGAGGVTSSGGATSAGGRSTSAGGTTSTGGTTTSGGTTSTGGKSSSSGGRLNLDAGLDGGTKANSKGDSGCGCRTVGHEPGHGAAPLSLGALVSLLFGTRRRRIRRSRQIGSA